MRPGLLATVAATCLTAVAVPAITQQVHLRDQRQQGQMISIATAMHDPAGAARRSGCSRDEFLVRCLDVGRAPDTVAREAQAALSQAAGRSAQMVCTNQEFGAHLRTCLVRIDEGTHAVMVSVDAASPTAPSASVVRIDAS